jgi:hypothetical protein
MSRYTLNHEFADLPWFHSNAMTLIAGMPVTVRAAGKVSALVTDSDALERAIPDPAQFNWLQPILAEAFGEIVVEATDQITNKMQIPAMKGQLEEALRQKVEPKFNALGLHITSLAIEQLQAV